MSNDLILSNITSYFVVAYRAIPFHNKILIQFQRFRYAKNSIEIIDAELKLNNKRILNTSDKENIPFIKGIVFKNVDFSYDSTHFIKNLNLEIKKGEIIGSLEKVDQGKVQY